MFLRVWIINLVVVSWNIYSIGNTWVEARHSGGWIRFVVWAGAFMTTINRTDLEFDHCRSVSRHHVRLVNTHRV